MNRYYFTLTKGKRPHHKCDNDIGVYGIYIDDELVYIGGTGRGSCRVTLRINQI